jgi:NAD(P)H-dependent FMN reductase
MIQKIETADPLVVGTPISDESHTGLPKHLLDLLTPSMADNRSRSSSRPTVAIVTPWSANIHCGRY